MRFDERVDALFPLVQKPSRYIGGEFGSVVKDIEPGMIRYCFAFPDVYEVGMSNLGMKILTDTVNRRADAWCERAFSPAEDMRKLMVERDVSLFSIESRTPLSEFDLIGFTLQYEMSYTNVLDALMLSGIPLRADERDSGPFIMAGGPCAMNPEPLCAFIDLFMLGDGERVTHEVLNVYKTWRESGAPRDAFLKAASGIEGVYVPSLYDAQYHSDGTVEAVTPKPLSGAPERVMRALVADLDSADFPETLVVPYSDIVHDRIMLELFRGCTRGCRFCQAGMIYRPVRERSVERLMDLADKLVNATGYDEVSLMSLSSGDYSCIAPLAKRLTQTFETQRVSISLPSLRIDSILGETLDSAGSVRKGGLTLAPEAGSQRLRDVINKNVSEEDLLRSVRDAFRSGWSSVKLYFMIGLPTETDEDIEGIADLAAKVSREYFALPKGERPRGLRVSVSVSTFVPKPHTPFQWVVQPTKEEIVRRQAMLKTMLRAVKGVEYRYHEPDLSILEACFARGDRRLSDVLKRAHALGCRMDGWTEHFHMSLWEQAFDECGLNMAFYAGRERGLGETLPWDHLDTGVTKEFLLRELNAAIAQQTTPDCRQGCIDCGMRRYKGACAE